MFKNDPWIEDDMRIWWNAATRLSAPSVADADSTLDVR